MRRIDVSSTKLLCKTPKFKQPDRRNQSTWQICRFSASNKVL